MKKKFLSLLLHAYNFLLNSVPVPKSIRNVFTYDCAPQLKNCWIRDKHF